MDISKEIENGRAARRARARAKVAAGWTPRPEEPASEYAGVKTPGDFLRAWIAAHPELGIVATRVD